MLRTSYAAMCAFISHAGRPAQLGALQHADALRRVDDPGCPASHGDRPDIAPSARSDGKTEISLISMIYWKNGFVVRSAS